MTKRKEKKCRSASTSFPKRVTNSLGVLGFFPFSLSFQHPFHPNMCSPLWPPPCEVSGHKLCLLLFYFIFFILKFQPPPGQLGKCPGQSEMGRMKQVPLNMCFITRNSIAFGTMQKRAQGLSPGPRANAQIYCAGICVCEYVFAYARVCVRTRT